MAISFVNKGAKGAAASGGITLGAPASPLNGDVWVAVIHSTDQVAHTLTGWTEIAQGNGGSTKSRLSVWYFRYAGTAPNLIVGHTAGDTIVGGIIAFRGCKQTDSPVDTVGSISTGTDATIEVAGITPSVAGCMLIIADGSGDDNNRTPPSGFTYRIYDSTAIKCYKTTFGSDGSVAGHTKLHTSGPTGNFVDSQPASDPWASVLIALAPTPPGSYTLTCETGSFAFTGNDANLNYGGDAGTHNYYPMTDSAWKMEWNIAAGGNGKAMIDEEGAVVYTNDNIYIDAGTGTGGKVAAFDLYLSGVDYVDCPMVPWTGRGPYKTAGSHSPIELEVNAKQYGAAVGHLKGFLRYNGVTYYGTSVQGISYHPSVTASDVAYFFYFWDCPWPVTGLTNWGVALNGIEFGVEKETDTGGIQVGRMRLVGRHPVYTPATPNTPDTLWAQTGQNIIDSVGGEVNPTDLVPWNVALSALMHSNGMGGCKIQVGTDGETADMWDSGLLQFGETVNDDERCPHKHYAGTNVLQDGITYYWRICGVSVYSEDSAWTAWNTFVGVTDPEWGDFVNYHNRANMRAGTSHTEYGVDYTLKIPFKTGFGVKVDTCGMVNESIQHSARQIAYYEDFGYRVYGGYSSASSKLKIFIKKYDYDLKTFGAAVEVHDTNQYSDSHYYACILIGADNKLHLFVGGHDTKGCYYRTTGAHVDGSGIDITSWETPVEPTGLSNATYIRPVMDSTGTIYLFFRHDLVLEEVHHRGHLCYIYSTDNGANWSDRQYVVYYSDYVGSTAPSIYIGGIAIDANDRVHICICWWEKYGTGGNMGRGISCIYADKTNGKYETWYEFGTVASVGVTTTTRGSTNVQYADVTKIAVCGNPTTLEGPFVHTNSEALVVDNLNYPHFVYYSYSAADRTGEETPVFYVYWSGSAWVTVDLYTDKGFPKLWKYRQGGQLYYDDGEIHIYGFVKPTGETWFGGELYHYRRVIATDGYAGWYMSSNSGKGIGMISVLPKRYPGHLRELLFCRGEDVVWLEDQPTGWMRYDGNDIRVVETAWNSGTPIRTELDRLPDAFQMEETFLQVGLNTAIPVNKTAPTDKIIQVYYDLYDATNPPRDIADVFLYLENFEGYASNGQLHGQGGWTVADYPASVIVLSSYDQANYPNAHTNKLWDGDRYLKMTGGIAEKNLADTYPGLGPDITNVEIIFHIWDEGGVGTVYLELYDLTADHWVRFGFNSTTQKAFYWADDGAGSIDGALTMSSNRYFEYRMIVNGSGVSGYVGNTAIFENNTRLTVFDKIKIASSGGGTQIHIIDSIRIVKWVASAPAVTMTFDIAEMKFSPGSSRMANILILLQNAVSRQAHLTALTYQTSARQAGFVFPQATAISRQAHLTRGDKEELARMMGIVVAQATAGSRQAEIVQPEASLAERCANLIIGQIIGYDRIAHAAQGEATELDRIAHILELLMVDQSRIAQIVNLQMAAADRQAHLIQGVAEALTRQANIAILEIVASGRQAHYLRGEAVGFARLMNILTLEVPPQSSRQAHLVKAEDTEIDRLAQLLQLELSGSSRLYQIIVPYKTVGVRLANIVQGYVLAAGSRMRNMVCFTTWPKHIKFSHWDAATAEFTGFDVMIASLRNVAMGSAGFSDFGVGIAGCYDFDYGIAELTEVEM